MNILDKETKKKITEEFRDWLIEADTTGKDVDENGDLDVAK